MSTELDDQLAAYGAWLGQSTGADLSPSDKPLDDTGRNLGADDRPNPARVRWAIIRRSVRSRCGKRIFAMVTAESSGLSISR